MFASMVHRLFKGFRRCGLQVAPATACGHLARSSVLSIGTTRRVSKRWHRDHPRVIPREDDTQRTDLGCIKRKIYDRTRSHFLPGRRTQLLSGRASALGANVAYELLDARAAVRARVARRSSQMDLIRVAMRRKRAKTPTQLRSRPRDAGGGSGDVRFCRCEKPIWVGMSPSPQVSRGRRICGLQIKHQLST